MVNAANGPASPLVLAPPERLVTGGGAEVFEEQLHDLLTEGGHRAIVVDLTGVEYMDSSGIRALVRGYTTSRRTGANVVFACAGPRVERLLQLTRLDRVLHLCDSIEAAVAAARSGSA